MDIEVGNSTRFFSTIAIIVLEVSFQKGLGKKGREQPEYL